MYVYIFIRAELFFSVIWSVVSVTSAVTCTEPHGYVAGPDCVGFWRCSWGTSYWWDCPSGTIFSSELNVCVWKGGEWDNGCVTTEQTTTVETTTTAMETTTKEDTSDACLSDGEWYKSAEVISSYQGEDFCELSLCLEGAVVHSNFPFHDCSQVITTDIVVDDVETKEVECQSVSGPVVCSASNQQTIVGVILVQDLSSGNCMYGLSYGYQGDELWLDFGCWGVFRLVLSSV